jgi:hypothetical protein
VTPEPASIDAALYASLVSAAASLTADAAGVKDAAAAPPKQ